MDTLLAVGGVALVVLAMLDILWTTLWMEGHSGPLAGRLTHWINRLLVRAIGDRHAALSVMGPLTLMTAIVFWVLMLWTGWTLFFSADPAGLTQSHTGAASTLVDRIYFTGYSMFTLGNGDFSPQTRGLKLATALTTMSGLMLVTLVVTYLLSVLEAIVAKRSFASQVFALGASAESFVCNAWDGRGFGALDLQLLSLVEQLNQVTEQHRAYPMLHYDHSAEERSAASSAVVVLADAVLLLGHGVTPEHRPSPTALHCAREAVGGYLNTLESAYVEAADEPPPMPELHRVRAAGIPTVQDEAFAAAVRDADDRRRLLLGLLGSERRRWPPSGA